MDTIKMLLERREALLKARKIYLTERPEQKKAIEEIKCRLDEVSLMIYYVESGDKTALWQLPQLPKEAKSQCEQLRQSVEKTKPTF